MSDDHDDAGAAGRTPPRGWELPREQAERSETDSLSQLVEELLGLVPDELRLRLTEAVRTLLEAIRALIDWCVARLQARTDEPIEVRDIPIL